MILPGVQPACSLGTQAVIAELKIESPGQSCNLHNLIDLMN